MTDVGTITRVLLDCREGGDEALMRLMTLIYDDLLRLAHRQRNVGPRSPTLNTTGLVHEAYIRMVDQTVVEWQDRSHFMAGAARAMRFILIDYARRQSTLKRNPSCANIPRSGAFVAYGDNVESFLQLDLALKKLETFDQRLIRVVECRIFAGLTAQETADALGVSRKTVHRDWNRARAWLKTELPALEAC